MMFTGLMATALGAAEQGRVPDALIRVGIRRLLHERTKRLSGVDVEASQATLQQFLTDCSTSRIAEVPEKANEQHYEVPADFFLQALGPRLKYSCCHWGDGVNTLAQAEESALRITCERAQIADGSRILELGCGWGSLSLWMAEKFPQAQILGVSNSHGQREFIESQARQRGFSNLRIVTADMNDFATQERFDRVVSVEMFEHMRNHAELLRRVSTWLNPLGKLFVHVFCHRSQPYLFEDNGPQDWMTRFFFSGGMMPSNDLFVHYQRDLNLIDQWCWNGRHYAKTCRAWLALTDERCETVLPLMELAYGRGQGAIWLQRWRIFFMACEELFAYRSGSEWFVSQYLFEKPAE